MNPITIRTATETDIETVVANNIAMAAETEDRTLDRATVLAGVRQLLADPTRGVYYLAEQGGRVIGQLMITHEWSDWRNGMFWWIQSVFVQPKARRAGIYRALHTHVEQRARNTPGVCGLRLYVERENRRAQQVYEHMGMTATSYRLYETDWSG